MMAVDEKDPPKVALEKKDVYAQAGEMLRHYLSWREKLLAGYVAIIAALAVAVVKLPPQYSTLGPGVAVMGMALTAMFWLLERRNRALFNRCITAGMTLEKELTSVGTFTELYNEPAKPSHSAVLDWFFGLATCFLFAAAIVLGEGNVATAARLTANDEAAIRQALDAEMKAADAADAAGWASLYTSNAIVLRPHATAVQGRDAIQQWLATLPHISNAKAQGVEVMGYGDLAYLRGAYSMTFSIPGVPSPIDEWGKFLQIYRKQSDGSWKMTREIYNSDLPLPVPAQQLPVKRGE
jgi:ketosteroid isomerase-like protein